jgi:hypothetical protein
MIDLETLGVTAGSVILSLGAVVFDESGVLTSRDNAFYAVIQRKSCEEIGMTTEPDTIAWWNRQSDDARRVLMQADDESKSVPLSEVLSYFHTWLVMNSAFGAPIWANGAAFDFPILGFAYHASGWEKLPWTHREERCYRTLKALYPQIMREYRPGVVSIAHNALDDAEAQALHAAHLLSHLRISQAIHFSAEK